MAESILGGLSQEATSLEMLSNITLLLAAMLEKMPRVTGNDQCAVSVEGTPIVGISGAQTLATVTTVGTVTTLGTMTNVTNIGGKPASTSADAISMSGTQHIYSNIIVS